MMVAGVFLAGAAGAAMRYVVDGFVSDRTDGRFPFGTFTVNVSGSFALGILAGYALVHGASAEPLRVLVGVGFIGAYTTFSTWMLQTFDLIRHGSWRQVVINLLGSTVAGLVAAGVGLWIGGALA